MVGRILSAMKVLIPIVIGLLVVGCENKQSTKTNLGDNASTKPLKKKFEKETLSKATDYNSTEINPRKTTATEVSITVIESGNGLEHNIQIEAVGGAFDYFSKRKRTTGSRAGTIWLEIQLHRSICFTIKPTTSRFMLKVQSLTNV